MRSVYVITSCKNAGDTINETITSVVSQGGDFRLYYHVQDAVSIDGTIEILKNWKYLIDNKFFPVACRELYFSYASEPDKGMYDGIQKGYAQFSISADSFMTWVNADDILVPYALSSILKVEKDIPEVKWITGDMCHLKDSAITQTHKDVYFPKELVAYGLADYRIYHSIQQEGTFWKTSLFEEVGGLNVNLKYAGDFDLWMRMAKLETLWSYPAALACFRNRQGQLSNDLEAYSNEIDQCVDYKEKVKAWEKYLNGLRQNNGLAEHPIIRFDYARNVFLKTTLNVNDAVPSFMLFEKMSIYRRLKNKLKQYRFLRFVYFKIKGRSK